MSDVQAERLERQVAMQPLPVEPVAPERPRFGGRIAAVLLAGAVILAGCGRGGDVEPAPTARSETVASPTPGASVSPEAKRGPEGLLGDTAESLLAAGEAVNVRVNGQPREGLRFKSAIQAPHYQTDIDVGAAGVGKGFLALAREYPTDGKWLEGAKETANWLMSVAVIDASADGDTAHWPDYADDQDVSPDAYTSFDDGALGVGDFFWELYEVTQDPEHKEMALASLRWTLAQAERVDYDGKTGYRWRWNTDPDSDAEYKMGMGEGVVGVIHTLTTYYERLKESDPALAAQCKAHVYGALAFLGSDEHGGDRRALPETDPDGGADGNTNMNAGYLSGAAGEAFMRLQVAKVFNDRAQQKKATESLAWLMDANIGPLVNIGSDKVAWKLAIDPEGGDDEQYATGFEEGAAGIGWVLLQAYKATGNKQYLAMAEKAGNWLVAVANKSGAQYSWNEDLNPRNPIIHANLNNGAAGIAMFLMDLSVVSSGKNKVQYGRAAQGALNWITAIARRDANGRVYWADNDGDAN